MLFCSVFPTDYHHQTLSQFYYVWALSSLLGSCWNVEASPSMLTLHNLLAALEEDGCCTLGWAMGVTWIFASFSRHVKTGHYH